MSKNKTLEVETVSIEDLGRKGYKQRQDGSGWYLGNSKWPTHRISGEQEKLLGRTFKVMGLKDDKVLVEDLEGNEYYLPHLIVKTKLKKIKTEKLIFRDDVISYNGYGFNFPCSMRNMGEDEAVYAAKWILKVVKQ